MKTGGRKTVEAKDEQARELEESKRIQKKPEGVTLRSRKDACAVSLNVE